MPLNRGVDMLQGQGQGQTLCRPRLSPGHRGHIFLQEYTLSPLTDRRRTHVDPLFDTQHLITSTCHHQPTLWSGNRKPFLTINTPSIKRTCNMVGDTSYQDL